MYIMYWYMYIATYLYVLGLFAAYRELWLSCDSEYIHNTIVYYVHSDAESTNTHTDRHANIKQYYCTRTLYLHEYMHYVNCISSTCETLSTTTMSHTTPT